MSFKPSPAARHILARPALADRFEILNVLGEGSVATVYLALDRAHGERKVALKILVNDHVFAEQTTRRFVEEALVSAEVVHPNLVAVYEVIRLEDTVALTMEYVDGIDLAQLIERGPASASKATDIVVQLCAALEALHAHGLAHRDVKLENIFLRSDGVVKLGDFGLVVRKSTEKPAERQATLVGTPAYMPPEYVESGRFDAAGDIWAAGLVLYELAVGRRRLVGKFGSEALDYLMRTQYKIPALPLTGLPKKLVAIIERALQVDPARRFSSAASMRTALLAEDADGAGKVEVSARIDLREFAASADKLCRWRERLSLSRVALALGVFFVAASGALWFARGDGAAMFHAAWPRIEAALESSGVLAAAARGDEARSTELHREGLSTEANAGLDPRGGAGASRPSDEG